MQSHDENDLISDDSKVGNAAPEVDKMEYLEIITSTFSKIANSLHPKLGHSLNQISALYSHFITQIEQNN